MMDAMNTMWKLRLPLFNSTQQQVCRHMFESLRQDPHVFSVYLGRSTESPYHADLHITFREGFHKPANPTFHALPILYPETHTEPSESFVLTRPTLEAPLSYEYSPRIQPFPVWVYFGQWVQHRNGQRAEVMRLCPGEISSVILREWRETGDSRAAVPVSTLEEEWEPVKPPVEGSSWHKRILGDDLV